MIRLLSLIIAAAAYSALSHLPFLKYDGGASSNRLFINKESHKTFFILWGALFLCYIPCFLAFYPGIYNNDITWQWGMYLQKHYNTHHPLIHTLMADWLFELGKSLTGFYNMGLAIYSVLQLLIFGKLLLLFLAGIVAAQLALMALSTACHAEKGKMNEMLSVPSQQMARAYIYHGEELSDAEKAELFRFIPEDALRSYVYYISDPVKNNLNEMEVRTAPEEFVKLWLRMGLRYPREYIEAFLDNTFGIWYLTGDTGSNLPYEYREALDSEHYFTEASYLPALKEVYKWFHYKNYEKYLPIISMIFYMPFFCWMTLFGSFVILEKRNIRVLILAVFGRLL